MHAVLIFVFVLLCSVSPASEAVALEEVKRVFESYKNADTGKRPSYFSQELIAYSLGTILEERASDDVIKDVNIQRNIINFVDKLTLIEKYEFKVAGEKPTLTIYYVNDQKRSKKLVLEFVKTIDGGYLIDHMSFEFR